MPWSYTILTILAVWFELFLDIMPNLLPRCDRIVSFEGYTTVALVAIGECKLFFCSNIHTNIPSGYDSSCICSLQPQFLAPWLFIVCLGNTDHNIILWSVSRL